MRIIDIDIEYIKDVLFKLLSIPSPTGYTDNIVLFVCEEFQRLGISYELTRRGAIRATIGGERKSPDRALVAHLDTIGALVTNIKSNGRLGILPIGHWSARFAEGARVTIFSDITSCRGSILPLKASGHAYSDAVDSQPISWENVEVRIDEICYSTADILKLGINVGDYLAVDAQPEFLDSGFINSRHLDDKAGVAVLLGTAKALINASIELPIDCHLLLTISEEVGSGASAILHGDVAEMVTIDNAVVAPGRNSSEFGVTVAMADSSGPFDYHLTHSLLGIAREFEIPHQRDVFQFYRSDSASAVESGNDLRTSLIGFGVDASHGYERTHIDSLESMARLLTLYAQSGPLYQRDSYNIGPKEDFPTQP